MNLYQHQVESLERTKNFNRCAYFHDMGLGKTLQTLLFVSLCKTMELKEDFNSVLIVAPVSLLSNWKEEFYKFKTFI